MKETIGQQLDIKNFPFTIKDKNDNQIYWEEFNRFWIKTEYDSNGNTIYVVDSRCYWHKSEYDSKGQEVYHENSDGKIVDKRNSCRNLIYEDSDCKPYNLCIANTTLSLIQPLEMKWQPKEDITGYELAMCLPYLLQPSLIMPHQLPVDALYMRHFEIVNPNSNE